MHDIPHAVPVRPFQLPEVLPDLYPAHFHSSTHDCRLENLAGRTDIPAAPLMTFGLEAEFTVTKNPNIVLDFCPEDEDERVWEAMPWKERMHHLLSWKQRMFGVASTRRVCLRRMSDRPRQLPETLSLEANGVFEYRSPSFARLPDLARYLIALTRTYGPAQLQGHVVFQKQPLNGLTGYTIAEADRALLLNLRDEWTAHQTRKRVPATHFISAFLAPLNHEQLREVAQGERDLAAGADTPLCPKYLYAPALRSGKTYGNPLLAGLEIRQWDFPNVGEAPLPGRAGLLVESMAVCAQFLASEEKFASLAPFAWTQLVTYDKAMQWLLAEECGSAPEWSAYVERIGNLVATRNGKSYRTDPRLAFLAPLRPWQDHLFLNALSADDADDIRRAWRTATRTYVQTLWELQKLDDANLLAGLRVAVATWAVQSRLSEAAEAWFRNLAQNPPPAQFSGILPLSGSSLRM